MSYVFYGYSNFSFLNLTKFNTSNVIIMGYMFVECKSLILLDLSIFNTSSVQVWVVCFMDVVV